MEEGDGEKKKKSMPAGMPKIDKASSAYQILQQLPDAPLDSVMDINEAKKSAFTGAGGGGESTGAFKVPEAAANCLAGMNFVFTGTLPNLGRSEGKEIVERYGGKVTSAMSLKTTCVVLGENAGPKKVEMIKDKNIKAITEDGFAELLRRMPPDGGEGVAASEAAKKREKEAQRAQEESEEMARRMEKEEAERRARQQEQKGKQKAKSSQPYEEKVYRDAEANDLWTVKYAPRVLKDICGNKKKVEELSKWLQGFEAKRKNGFKSKDDLRAVLISGPPGIGKTTAAHVVAKSMGYDVIESNASDTRSKKLLSETVSQRLDNKSLSGFFGADAGKDKQRVCLILDEVDGMSAGDRGGVGQMAKICRETKIPLILCCNDKRLPKMRPLDKVTLDLAFRRPSAAEIRARIMSICHKEKIKIDPNAIDKMYAGSGNDLRQTINMISTFARNNKSLSFDQGLELANDWTKNTSLKPFDIVGRLMSSGIWQAVNKVSFNDKLEMYFFDHDLAPLFVQENYINYRKDKNGSNATELERLAKAAESISDGDICDRLIHGPSQQWSLMPVHGALSTVIPAYNAHGLFVPPNKFSFGPSFPSFLGNLSKGNKYKRLLQEIQSHVRLKTSSDGNEFRQQYLPLLTEELLKPFADKNKSSDEAIEETIQLMEEYYLTKEDWNIIMEMNLADAESRANSIDTKTKTAFTRAYNTTDHPMPFMRGANAFKVGTAAKQEADFEGAFVDDSDDKKNEDEDEADDDDDDISKDKYIKAKKPRAVKGATAKSKASTSKAKTSKKK